jgi:hypothetical protein
VARKKQMTLVAARKPQLRKRAKRDWSKAKAREFLSVLADTCNVSEACRKSGVPMTVAYRRRKMDAAFRAAWAEAIAIGYQRLEGVLLERAFNGTEKLFTRKDGSEERMREYPNQLGLQLLKMHRQTAAFARHRRSNWRRRWTRTEACLHAGHGAAGRDLHGSMKSTRPLASKPNFTASQSREAPGSSKRKRPCQRLWLRGRIWKASEAERRSLRSGKSATGPHLAPPKSSSHCHRRVK